MIRKQGVPEEALKQRIEQVFQESGVVVWEAALAL